MLYPTNKSIKNYKKEIWDIQKSIEAEEKWAQKREEQEKKIKKNKFGSKWIV